VFRWSFRTAESHHSTTIICQDPDTDRVRLAVKYRGEWRILHGNHTGTLLTWWLTKHFASDRSRGLLLCSTVSI
jgi:phosphomannomutase